MIADVTTLDATQYSVQYELLRSQVVGTVLGVNQANTAGVMRGIGLALLLSEGIPGWLKTVESVLRVSLVPRTVAPSDPSLHETLPKYSAAPVWPSATLRNEVTTLLASLVLSTRLLARSSSKGDCQSC